MTRYKDFDSVQFQAAELALKYCCSCLFRLWGAKFQKDIKEVSECLITDMEHSLVQLN